MLLKEVEEKTGVSAKNIYKYIKLGLVEPKQSSKGATYEFTEEHVDIIKLIRAITKLQLFQLIKNSLGGKLKSSKIKELVKDSKIIIGE